MVSERNRLASNIAFSLRKAKSLQLQSVTDILSLALHTLVGLETEPSTHYATVGSERRTISLCAALEPKCHDASSQTTAKMATESEFEAFGHQLFVQTEEKLRDFRSLMDRSMKLLEERAATIEQLETKLFQAEPSAPAPDLRPLVHDQPLQNAQSAKRQRLHAALQQMQSSSHASIRPTVDLETLRRQHRDERLAQKAARRLARQDAEQKGPGV